MSEFRNIRRSGRMSVRAYLAAGVGGAAIVSAGVSALAAPPGAPTAATADVQLASTGSDLWWLEDGDGDGIGSAMALTPNALTGGGPLFGLIGNGVDAQPGCVGDACNGGNGGFFFGRGGTAGRA